MSLRSLESSATNLGETGECRTCSWDKGGRERFCANLLLEIAGSGQPDDWRTLAGHVRDLFQIEIHKPVYASAQPYIICEYSEPNRIQRLDLPSAGSGTLQVLLLLAFLYARPATVVLLDEPDAHQHVTLQRQVYDLIRKVARERGGQLVVATHSEVILESTAPERILRFFGAGETN